MGCCLEIKEDFMEGLEETPHGLNFVNLGSLMVNKATNVVFVNKHAS